ncbi:pyridoxamine 5'-phosphate oxidase [Cupriavidus respiraculi]|uniref:pyridoxamine 5'-phosphate oxidase n=1 Tax=Cupriavidus respiraculi TaxID=195930 RepID=UPI001C950399|nr:pyridoxamine 5'-phosphate oxidase [Cupriavidus respiraculi]MBY4948834.1 pyridoxamine 5'-phosphate oxidase [Cupriavidus respiraculi]
MNQLADLRRSYVLGSLNEADVAADPITQFERWFDEALNAKLPEPNAMTLATVDAAGQPSARIVLLKGIDARGFTFFTNYESRKGADIAANPRAALLFHWVQLERQARIEGVVEKVSDAESDAYYASRPLGSRLGAWASEQSREVANRAVLEQREAEFREKFGEAPPRPAHWGGYRVVPTWIEFWQGRPSRLHDRIGYRREADGNWRIVRLSP